MQPELNNLYDPADHEIPSNYCEHGTFIGNPYGADLLCHYCETGYTAEDAKLARFFSNQQRREQRRNMLRMPYEFAKRPDLLRRLDFGLVCYWMFQLVDANGIHGFLETTMRRHEQAVAKVQARRNK